jgi:hypothetical protein
VVDIDRFAARHDGLPPSLRQSLPYKNGERRTRKSVGEQDHFGDAVDAGVGKDFERATLLDAKTPTRHRRAPPGNLSARSLQFGLAVAPSLPHLLQRMRGPNDGTATCHRAKRRR